MIAPPANTQIWIAAHALDLVPIPFRNTCGKQGQVLASRTVRHRRTGLTLPWDGCPESQQSRPLFACTSHRQTIINVEA